jgi:hypothetical protein
MAKTTPLATNSAGAASQSEARFVDQEFHDVKPAGPAP